MISQRALECEIMSMGSEDEHGLHEIVWMLNVSHPGLSKPEKIVAAQAAVRALLARRLIELHRLQWDPTRDYGVIPIG